MPVLFSYPYLTLHYYPGPAPTIETEWLSYVGSTDFRQALVEALHAGQQYQVQGWVADDRRLGAVRPRDLDWIRKEILPALAQAGLRRFALIEAHDTLNRLTIDRMYQQAVPNVSFEIRAFTDPEQARTWASGN